MYVVARVACGILFMFCAFAYRRLFAQLPSMVAMDITNMDFPWKRLWPFLLKGERHRLVEAEFSVYQMVAGTPWRQRLRDEWGFHRMQDLLLKLEWWQKRFTRTVFVAWRAHLLKEEVHYKMLAKAWRAWSEGCSQH